MANSTNTNLDMIKENKPKMVKIKLPKTAGQSKGLYVNVNNYNMFIPRGETVEVPDFIEEVIRHSVEQDEETLKMIESLTSESEF